MSLLETFASITTFVLDVDGVLTDGTLTLLPGGVMARKMNVKDGYALQLAIKKGYTIAIISGGISEEVSDRLSRLGVKEVFMKVKDKVEVMSGFLDNHSLNWNEVLYMGDDIPDLEVMETVQTCLLPGRCRGRNKRSFNLYISPAWRRRLCTRRN